MSAFHDVLFPTNIAIRADGGPGWETEVVKTAGGQEQRIQLFSRPLHRYRVAHVWRTRSEFAALFAFFNARRGRAYAFRVRDWADYSVVTATGLLGSSGVGSGEPTYQLTKKYADTVAPFYRPITKPVSGSVTVSRNSSPVTVGAGAGQIAINHTTGIVTFVADSSQSVTGHTPGASHAFTTANNITQLGIGDKVYLSGVTGTGAATLNAKAHTITNKTGAGPYTWTISTATTGLTTSGGTAYAYPQSDEPLTWVGEFDVPCRFDSDVMEAHHDQQLMNWPDITLVEAPTE